MPKPENIEPYKMKPGTTLNPHGRPKGSRNLSTILKEVLQAKDPDDPSKTMGDKLIKKLIEKANKGDVRAIDLVFDRTEGKAKQEIKHDIAPDQSIEVKITKPKGE